jgi:membrane protease YdiL (CAAX protease family)
MNKLIQQLSPRAEFVIVTTTGFGYFTFTSLVWFLYILTAPADFSMPALSDTDLYSIVGYEIIALLLISNFLYLRGWSMRDFNLQLSWRLTGAGILLALAYYFIYYFLWIVVEAVLGPFEISWTEPASVNPGLSLTAILIASIVNPLFEESLVTGYIMKSQTARKGVWYAINISIFIRLLYHLYQGPLVVIGIVPLGWLFAYVYARWNRLWPIIIAHGILDFIALSAN